MFYVYTHKERMRMVTKLSKTMYVIDFVENVKLPQAI